MDCMHAADHCPHCTNQTAVISSLGVREQYVPPPEEGLVPQPLFIPPPEPTVVWTGAQRLLLAVLKEAVHTFLKGHNARSTRGKRAFREAQIWFLSKENHWLYAFESICQHLHLDPDYIRRGLTRCQQAAAELSPQAQPARHVHGTHDTLLSTLTGILLWCEQFLGGSSGLVIACTIAVLMNC